MKIQVLGSGCPTCRKLYQTVKEVTAKLDPDLTVEYSTDVTKIVQLGAMSSPVLAIDSEVITAGKLPTNEEIERAIKEKMKN